MSGASLVRSVSAVLHRLWYRVGARMAQRIENDPGRPALVELIR
jgi:hypothetical protein